MRTFPEYALTEIASAEVIEALAYGGRQAAQRLGLLNGAQGGIAVKAQAKRPNTARKVQPVEYFTELCGRL